MRSGGLKVYTTVDPRFQHAAVKSIREVLYERGDPAAAVISINPRNGEIRAMTAVTPGNNKNQFNLLSQARRQAGSTFKTFVLAAAVEQGINPATSTYNSAPFFYRPTANGDCETGAGGWWCPETYDHSYTGYTSIERATLRSDNTVYAQLTLDVTPEAVAKMATKLGVRSPTRRQRRVRARDRPRREGGVPARHGVGLRDARGRRHLLRADGHPQGRPAGRRGQELGQVEAPPRDLGRRRLRGDADPRGEHAVRDGHRRGVRPGRGRQDRHDGGALGRVVLPATRHGSRRRSGSAIRGRRSR